MRSSFYPSKAKLRGLSLVEFMVASAIGLLIMAGVITALSSALQTRTRRVEVESAMESYRFAAQVLTMKIKNACSIDPSSSSNQLVLNSTGSTTESIFHSSTDNSIRLTNATATNQVLVDSIYGITFEYGMTTNPVSDRISDGNASEYVASSTVTAANWTNVRSIKVTIKMLGQGLSEGLTETFIATVRAKMLTTAACV